MKKILITGMNKNQTTKDFYLRQQLKVVPSHYSLIRCLEDMGYEVEQRLVKIGEDLSEYHRVICFLASPRQALQLAFYNGLWAIHATPKENLVLAFDDWQTDDIFKGIQSCKDKESLLKEFTIGQNKMCDPDMSFELLEPHTQTLLDTVNYIGEKKAPMLLSVFMGGDLSKLVDYPKDLLVGYNPNPYHRNRRPGDRGDIDINDMEFMEAMLMPSIEEDTVKPENKQRCFNFASLVQGKTKRWLKQQNAGAWDIEFFGSRKEKQRRLGEGDMCKVYAEQWGCLMPGYNHAGSGWWRARPLQLADAGSILIGEYDEMMLLYNDEELASLKGSDIINLSTDDLANLALRQKEALLKEHPLDKELQQKELGVIL
tara:strand:- start:398 stop:1510 length:1113 start_codon:yes stop_codon:yes gene_type:complete